MTSVASVRLAVTAAIISTLESVSGVENVYDGYPTAATLEEIVTKYREANTKNIQMWVVRRTTSIPWTHAVMPSIEQRCGVHLQHEFQIILNYGFVAQETEYVFQPLIDAALEAFLPLRTFGLQDEGVDVPQPMILHSIGPSQLSGVYVDQAVFGLTVWHRRCDITPV